MTFSPLKATVRLMWPPVKMSLTPLLYILCLSCTYITFLLKEAHQGFSLSCLNCHRHYSRALLCKIRVTWTLALRHHTSDLISRAATKRLMGGEHAQHGDTRQRDDSRSPWDRVRQCEISSQTQNGMQFKTNEVFISGIFHLIFSDRCWLQVTETTENKSTDKGDNCS